MKILNIDKYYYLKGGAERYYFELAKLLESHGHEVIPFSQKSEKNFNTLYEKYFPETRYRFFWSFSTAEKLRKLIDKEKPDIAHVHLIYHHLTPSVLWALKNQNIPVVLTAHDYKLICPNYTLYTQGRLCTRCKNKKYYQAIAHKCLKNSYSASAVVAAEMYFHKKIKIYERCIDMVVAPSEFVKEKFLEFGWPKKKITVIPHFIEKSKEKPDFNPGGYLLYFGRLSAEKGLDKIILAMYNAGLKINLKIAGDGPEKNRLQDLINKLGLADQIQFLGQLTDEKLQKAIKDCLLVVMPTQANESFGLSALEAFAQGKTVFASNKGALPEIVINNKTGMVFQNNLEAVLKDMVKNKDKIKQLAINAYQSVGEKYAPQSHYEKIISLYNLLLRRRAD